MTTVDLAAVESILADVAETEIMSRYNGLTEADIKTKQDKSVVTVADEAAEKALIEKLQAYLPGSLVIGEEGFEKSPDIISRLKSDAPVWIIDPIDGTRSFVNKQPEFGVMVALVQRQQTIAAWIHDPHTHHTLMAERGGGVWLQGHKMRLAGLDAATPPFGILSWHLYTAVTHENLVVNEGDMPELAHQVSCSFDYPRLFTGDVVFANSLLPRATFLMTTHTKPWDHLAGLFMLEEAKGYAATLLGSAYDPAMQQKDGLLSAPDRPTWERVRRLYAPAVDAFINSYRRNFV